MKQVGTFPTAYGVAVPTFEKEGVSPDDEVLFDMDGCMTMMGMHGPIQREACRAATRGRTSMPLDFFERHGGQKIPRIPIERPTQPAYLSFPAEVKDMVPVERWIDLILYTPRWCDRAEALLGIIGGNLEQDLDMPKEIMAFSMSILLTCALEHAAEKEIDCLEAAAFYALTIQNHWAEAGARWLEPMRKTWFRDWVKERPRYTAFASALRPALVKPFPRWIAGAS